MNIFESIWSGSCFTDCSVFNDNRAADRWVYSEVVLHHNGKTSSQEGQSVIDAQFLGSFLEEWEDPCNQNLEDKKWVYNM